MSDEGSGKRGRQDRPLLLRTAPFADIPFRNPIRVSEQSGMGLTPSPLLADHVMESMRAAGQLRALPQTDALAVMGALTGVGPLTIARVTPVPVFVLDQESTRAVEQIAEAVLELWCTPAPAASAPAAPLHSQAGAHHWPPLPAIDVAELLREHRPFGDGAKAMPAGVARALLTWGRASDVHRAACESIVRIGLARGMFSAEMLVAMVDEWLPADDAHESATAVLRALPRDALQSLARGIAPSSPRANVLPAVLETVCTQHPVDGILVLHGWSRQGKDIVDAVVSPTLGRIDLTHVTNAGELFRLHKAVLLLQLALRGTRAHTRAGMLVKQVRDQRSRIGNRKR